METPDRGRLPRPLPRSGIAPEHTGNEPVGGLASQPRVRRYRRGRHPTYPPSASPRCGGACCGGASRPTLPQSRGLTAGRQPPVGGCSVYPPLTQGPATASMRCRAASHAGVAHNHTAWRGAQAGLPRWPWLQGKRKHWALPYGPCRQPPFARPWRTAPIAHHGAFAAEIRNCTGAHRE
jgi:hypothetical protein